MPLQRRVASRILSFGTSIASAMRIRDSQCGFTATRDSVLKSWNWENSWKSYGYPNYWIIECSKQFYRVKEVEVRAIYGDEVSGISPRKFSLQLFSSSSNTTTQGHFLAQKQPEHFLITVLDVLHNRLVGYNLPSNFRIIS